jgi:hypothetical protein
LAQAGSGSARTVRPGAGQPSPQPDPTGLDPDPQVTQPPFPAIRCQPPPTEPSSEACPATVCRHAPEAANGQCGAQMRMGAAEGENREVRAMFFAHTAPATPCRHIEMGASQGKLRPNVLASAPQDKPTWRDRSRKVKCLRAEHRLFSCCGPGCSYMVGFSFGPDSVFESKDMHKDQDTCAKIQYFKFQVR